MLSQVDELVRKERLVEQCKARKGGTDNPKTWRDDEYLVARLRRFRRALALVVATHREADGGANGVLWSTRPLISRKKPGTRTESR